MKTRSLLIFHSHLKQVDPQLYRHLVAQKIEPELILIKMLKCLVSREFASIEALFKAWDYMIAGFKPELYDH